MLRVFATFLKKGSAKNFPTGKILGCFSKKVRSTVVVNRRAFFYYAVGAYRLGSAEHLIRHLSVTPSPTGEGNCKALFRQQIFYETIDGRMG